MKKFVLSVLGVAVFFVGLGTIVEKAGAKFKSDEKALDIVRKARAAIGGDAALAKVRSLTIVGRTTNSVKVDGAERFEQGETEIALQLPDKLMKMVKIGKDDGTGEKRISQEHEVVIVGKGEGEKIEFNGQDGEFTTPDGKKVIVKHRVDGNATFNTEDAQKTTVTKGANGETVVTKAGAGDPAAAGEKHVMMMRHAGGEAHGGMKQNELLRLTLGLLLTAPDGIDVSYTFAGESDLDGTAVNIVNAEFGGANYKLFIGKSSNLPVAMSYTGMSLPAIVKFTRNAPPPADGSKDVMVFTKRLEGEAPTTENFVRFADYRSTGSVQLPYKWTTSVGGTTSEVFGVTSYEINPANIAEKFANQKVFVRTAKPPQN